jgi:hypothetical protein
VPCRATDSHGDQRAEHDILQISKPNFSIGRFLATPTPPEALKEVKIDIIDLVERHFSKDRSDLSDEDTRLNAEALYDRSRIPSAYILPRGVKIWIII